MEDDFDRMMDRLTVIVGFSELLLGDAYGPLSLEQKRILHDLVAEARDLSQELRELAPSR